MERRCLLFRSGLLVLLSWFSCVQVLYSESIEKDVIKIKTSKNGDIAYIYKEERDGIISIIKSYYVSFNETISGPFDFVSELIVSPDGETLVYWAKIEYEYYVFDGKEKTGPFDEVGWLTFSPDGKTLAYIAHVDFESYITSVQNNFHKSTS